jgi:lysine-ketoglutarate reductase/saccharopine dehydrogenase-like protein (TIGR00300 family)
MEVKEIELKGHIIDSFILPKVFDTVMDLGGDFEVTQFEIGKNKTDPSYARILVKADDRDHLDRILGELLKAGAVIPEVEEIALAPAQKDKTLPEGFYTTTNHPTFILMDGEWVACDHFEMDKAIVVDKEEKSATLKPIGEIKEGDMVVVGSSGIRVEPPERPRGYSVFEFMKSTVSSEKPSQAIVNQIAEEMEKVKKSGKKILVVSGPAVVHTSAGDSLARLIREDYVDVFYGGNAIAVHDVESQLFGTSLGVNIKTGRPTEGGHRHHIYAINAVNTAGSIKQLVDDGSIKAGVMYEIIKKGIPCILAGSIRDDGPLPEVITDSTAAQREMRKNLDGVGMVLMLCTMLHSIAVGNMTGSNVKTICVDINPSTVTKLTDRGSAQALGIVTDVGVFLPMLTKRLLG